MARELTPATLPITFQYRLVALMRRCPQHLIDSTPTSSLRAALLKMVQASLPLNPYSMAWFTSVPSSQHSPLSSLLESSASFALEDILGHPQWHPEPRWQNDLKAQQHPEEGPLDAIIPSYEAFRISGCDRAAEMALGAVVEAVSDSFEDVGVDGVADQ